MPKNIVFTPKGWEDYLYWQTQGSKTIKRVNLLLKDIVRGGYEGNGKPEPLKHEYQGFWSRRIDEQNRLVYRIEAEQIFIVSCRSHYE